MNDVFTCSSKNPTSTETMCQEKLETHEFCNNYSSSRLATEFSRKKALIRHCLTIATICVCYLNYHFSDEKGRNILFMWRWICIHVICEEFDELLSLVTEQTPKKDLLRATCDIIKPNLWKCFFFNHLAGIFYIRNVYLECKGKICLPPEFPDYYFVRKIVPLPAWTVNCL